MDNKCHSGLRLGFIDLVEHVSSLAFNKQSSKVFHLEVNNFYNLRTTFIKQSRRCSCSLGAYVWNICLWNTYVGFHNRALRECGRYYAIKYNEYYFHVLHSSVHKLEFIEHHLALNTAHRAHFICSFYLTVEKFVSSVEIFISPLQVSIESNKLKVSFSIPGFRTELWHPEDIHSFKHHIDRFLDTL